MFENQIYVIAKPIFNSNVFRLELGIFFVFYQKKVSEKKDQDINKLFVL